MAIHLPHIRVANRDFFTRSEAMPQQRASYGGLTNGGLVNPNTGMGTSIDKGQGNFFTPTRIYWRTPC